MSKKFPKLAERPVKGNSAAKKKGNLKSSYIPDFISPQIRDQIIASVSNAVLGRVHKYFSNSSEPPSRKSLESDHVPSGVQSAPVSFARTTRNKNPTLKMSNGRARITHREYLGDISGSTSFAIRSYAVNPGNAIAFPWLSTVAINYEAYRFLKLHFVYETQVSTATSGSIMMAIDFDAADIQISLAPTNKVVIMNYNNAVRGSSWESVRYVANPTDMKTLGPQRYVRVGNLTSVMAAQNYDIGTFYLATQGFAGTTLVGELYVEYDIELITPSFDLAAITIARSARINSGGVVTAALPFGNAPTVLGSLPVSVPSGTTIRFDIAGDFMVGYRLSGAAIVAPTLVYTTGGSTVFHFNSVDVGGATSSGVFGCTVLAGVTLTFDCTASGAITGSILRIGIYSSALGLAEVDERFICPPGREQGCPYLSDGTLQTVEEEKNISDRVLDRVHKPEMKEHLLVREIFSPSSVRR